jgi:hypothetical protein
MSRTYRLVRVGLVFAGASIALFAALGGTAGASEQAAVPLAKRALVADNAKKLGGQTAAQIVAAAAKAGAALSAATPGPASTTAGLTVIKTGSGQVASESINGLDVTCDAGKLVGGGFSSDGAVIIVDSYPKSDTTWSAGGLNLGTSTANFTVYAICQK